jgi:osmotically-inducible protein OsmY
MVVGVVGALSGRSDAECLGHQRREREHHMSNSEIIDQVRVALDRDPRISHAGEVAVSEREGAVTLRGSVSSFRQRRAAVQSAKSIPGVRDVVDELRIDLRDHFEDDQVRAAALQALIWDPDVPDDRIDVTVKDGWLTLNGEVRHQHESDAAFEDVSRLRGVGGITNEIKVVTAGGGG